MSLLLLGANQFNVKQDLFSNNEQGLWLDPSDMTATKAGWRRNLVTYSEGNISTYSASNVTDTSMSGFDNAVYFGDNSATRTAYKLVVIMHGPITASCFVVMDDGLAPTDNDMDFIVAGGGGGTMTVTQVSGTLYRVSRSQVIVGTGLSANGLRKSTTNSSRGFKASGIQVEVSSTPTEYQPITDFSTEFKAAFPTHTLYQDSNGVTPCTAAGDQVGLVLDQSRGGLGALGPELVTNGGFDSSANWQTETNWSIGSGVASASSASGQWVYTAGYSPAITAGRLYRIEFEIKSISSGSFLVGIWSTSLSTANVSPTHSVVGKHVVFVTAPSAGNYLVYFDGQSNATGTIDNISVREVPGNHAYQSSSSARPTLARIPSSGRRNLITYSEELSNAAWNSIDVSSATRSGGNITLDNSDGYGYHRQDGGSFSTTTDHVVTVDVTSDTTVANVPFRLAGTVDVTSLVNLTAGQTTRLTFTGYRPFASSFRIGIDQRDVIVPGGSNATGYTVTFNRIQLETGSTATNYQKVVATTDVTESGFSDLYHLVFDGVDDSLTTNSVDFSGTAQMTVIAGVRKVNSSTAMIAELSETVNSNTGSFSLLCGNNPSDVFDSFSRGTAAPSASLGAQLSAAASETAVISSTHDISGDLTTIRRNGTAGTDATGDKGSGNFGNYALYIGRRGGSSLPFSGHIYQLIVRGTTTPTAKLLQAERFTARKTGVTGI